MLLAKEVHMLKSLPPIRYGTSSPTGVQGAAPAPPVPPASYRPNEERRNEGRTKEARTLPAAAGNASSRAALLLTADDGEAGEAPSSGCKKLAVFSTGVLLIVVSAVLLILLPGYTPCHCPIALQTAL